MEPGLFEKDYLGSCYDSLLKQRMSRQTQHKGVEMQVNDGMTYIPKIKLKHCTHWYARLRVSIDLAIARMKIKKSTNREVANG